MESVSGVGLAVIVVVFMVLLYAGFTKYLDLMVRKGNKTAGVAEHLVPDGVFVPGGGPYW